MRPPESPPAALQALLSAAGELGLDVTAAQADALLAHLDLLQRWNATYNLTAVRDPSAMLSQHLIDCLALVPALKRHLDANPLVRRLLDAGSGGGLPGVVLAVMLPALDVTCVDAVGKKAAFVRQVAGALALPNLHAVHSRVEAMTAAPFDVITSRAFASLADFVRWTDSRLAAGGVWLAMKGRAPDGEVAELHTGVKVFHVEPLQVPGLTAQRCLVWMRRAPGR
jgi:16S rRNA (guanine527-N7)-methyltransferase